MDYFESIVARMLESKGYWVHCCVRVELTKEEKRFLGKPSLPRPEIDLVAFHHRDRKLVLFEVKSYLDSPGVTIESLSEATPGEGRLKLLTDMPLQTLLKERVRQDYVHRGLIEERTTVHVGLAAGKVPKGNQQAVAKFMSEQAWEYIAPEDIAKWVRSRADEPYENDPVTLAAKLVLRSMPDSA